MNESTVHGEGDESFWAPGTLRLEDLTRSRTEVILHPIPTSDPDDPLNWSQTRKWINFGLVGFFVLWTFAQLQIGATSWSQLIPQLHFTVDQLNNGVAVNSAGLGIGCILFMPFVHKYGRRPLYLLSSALQLAGVVWQAKMQNYGDWLGCNFLTGLGGAISEAVVQVTIADLFFVHQHGTMNAWYLIFTSIGATLGPVASGFVVQSQGWRWIWWWCTIFLSVNFLLIAFMFEESKYVPVLSGQSVPLNRDVPSTDDVKTADADLEPAKVDIKHTTMERIQSRIDPTLPRKTYLQRMTLLTTSDYSVRHHFYQPVVILFMFPAVAYAALTYGTILGSLALMASTQATYLPRPPYNFGPSGVGLMSLAPFTGSFFGFFAAGWLNDKSIMWFARRNGGIYEPEMRLWLSLVSALVLPAGVLLFGISLAHGVHWIAMAVGFGMFGFTFVLASGVALAYVTDCYQEILGDAMIGITFVRNVFSVIILFTLTPWNKAMGIQNVAIITAAFNLAVLLLPVPLIIWGKKIRISTSKRYEQMARRQPAFRTLGEHCQM
ncbi:hypothetical protein COCC4DRAFT_69986 [Bipolaris maydis ATCC 48331]|uniref:Major facilitator superfamily (MFS) profile domain-containing protein n=2 Tax=Cochliobolus heterostrophus TaxID=5016 RepID=M2UXZ2_COCH5|nr:uncharacterized protein COCC4DRAFT_69986 [Bipolaris maydis ATCC 48331]EMD92688.1 hypothetical protein COCHEDRAFT_1224451 [Bipolaris maydis C5]KAJ5061183.1 major facilitator superfamily domain-containing protein [Bipolaris maydis]ENI08383.1 hypothetical protein COCC4DRAFT_69986 [Bipolaris maydis ATCC 48331]KAJ6198316.1 major facilitator superfamily domain-containing protein [Bipolaris maydis]KAJ6210453.1 major facilitator superfamily domain-containing protein [Bipolaris maydis]